MDKVGEKWVCMTDCSSDIGRKELPQWLPCLYARQSLVIVYLRAYDTSKLNHSQALFFPLKMEKSYSSLFPAKYFCDNRSPAWKKGNTSWCQESGKYQVLEGWAFVTWSQARKWELRWAVTSVSVEIVVLSKAVKKLMAHRRLLRYLRRAVFFFKLWFPEHSMDQDGWGCSGSCSPKQQPFPSLDKLSVARIYFKCFTICYLTL